MLYDYGLLKILSLNSLDNWNDVFDVFLCINFINLISSEDILNYEIGEVDADDTDLTVADEDELLLSDDGMMVF